LKPSDLPHLPKDKDGPVFAAPWEAQAFAMAVKLNEAGHFTWSEWAGMLGAELHAHPDQPYYESWLETLEHIVEKKGLMAHGERLARVGEWDEAAKATPHGQPIELSRSLRATGTAR
jgi:nitrile hydratase accessory protein